MNKKIPHTPFSTALSGSAKETELRLKNIFSGPKKRPPALFLALVFSICLLCGNLVSCRMAEAKSPEGLSKQEALEAIGQTDGVPVSTVGVPVKSDSLPLDEPVRLWFGSGAGAWCTILTLHPDGSFEGDYHDADGPILYVCQFHGRFGEITQISPGAWSMVLEELTLDTDHPVGEEWDGTRNYYAGESEGWIEERFHYISSEPYGFDDGDKALEPGAQFTFYTPDASASGPGSELYGMEDESSELYEFWTWWPQRHQITGTDEPLGCYALHNVTSGRGFFDFQSWGIE